MANVRELLNHQALHHPLIAQLRRVELTATHLVIIMEYVPCQSFLVAGRPTLRSLTLFLQLVGFPPPLSLPALRMTETYVKHVAL
jgi:hypothetical protein